MCVLIFEGEGNPSDLLVSGIDITIQPEMDEKGEIKVSDINFGKGKYFPGGPTCNFNGKTIDCQVYMSRSGGITAEILVSILKSIDDSGILPCIPGDQS